MIKIIATITDYGAAMNIGGDVERISHIINVPTQNIPERLKMWLEEKALRKHSTISLSLLREDE